VKKHPDTDSALAIRGVAYFAVDKKHPDTVSALAIRGLTYFEVDKKTS